MFSRCIIVLLSALFIRSAVKAQQVMPFPSSGTRRTVATEPQTFGQVRKGDLPPASKVNLARLKPREIALFNRRQIHRSRTLAAQAETTASNRSRLVVKSQDATTKIVTTIAGVTRTAYGNGGPATAAYLAYPEGVAVDAAGNFYIADFYSYQVRKVNAATGVVSAVAGTGQYGYTGDGQLAVNAQIGYGAGIAVDTGGNLYIADEDHLVIRRVDSVSGIISTVAGSGQYGYSGDGGAATLASLGYPTSVAVDAAGNLYIADTDDYLVRKVSAATGIITTVAGTPDSYGYEGDGGLATQAELGYVQGLAVDAAGNLYIADTYNSVVRVVAAATGIISTYAGNGSYLSSGDGGLALNAGIGYPEGIAVDGQGGLYITDGGNDSVRRVDGSTNIITTVAGNGMYGFAGDGGAATQAELYYPNAVAIDANGNLYIADEENNRIRQVNSAGTISSVAGNGSFGPFDDGVLAVKVPIIYPNGVAVDGSGNVFFVDEDEGLVREVRAADGTLVTVAGTGQYGYTGDGGLATNAELSYPSSIAFDPQGNLYIANFGYGVVRKVDHASGIITTVAGNGTSNFTNTGDGGAATSASLSNPSALAFDSAGNLYIAEEYPGYVRKVSPQGIISTVAGSGQYSYSGGNGDGGPATSAYLQDVRALAVDSHWNVYLNDEYSIREVSASSGFITTIAGNGQYGDSGDGGSAVNASLGFVQGLSFDAAGNLYSADDSTIRVINTSGIIGTIAGQAYFSGYSGDGGAVASAEVSPVSVAVDSAANIYFADTQGSRIRKISTGTPQAAAATPVLSPDTGSYGASQTVTITDSTPGAQIFYTLDGSVPDPGTSALYGGPLSLIGTVTVHAIAIAPGFSTSSGVSAGYTFPSATSSAPFTPAFTPAPGAYSTGQSVTILDATSGAPIYYTTDGSTPTAASIPYASPISVNATTTLHAIAISSGLSSPVASGAFVITSPTTTTVTANANPALLSAGVVFTAAITSPTAGTPTGTVSFSVDGGAALVEILNGSAKATYSVGDLTIGQHTITASYSGDSLFPASSGTLTETIGPGTLGQFIIPGTAVVFDPDNVLSASALAYLSSNIYGGQLSATPAVQVASFPAAAGQVVTLSASGAINCCNGTPSGSPDGTLPDANVSSLQSISGYSGPGLALVGVFTNGHPSGSAPANLDYSSGTAQPSYAPSLNQVFFVGDGLTETAAGATQSFQVPVTATELWLGVADTLSAGNGPPSGYGDNTGSFTVSGSFSGGLRFVPIAPCRAVDTRGAEGPLGGAKLDAGTSREFDLPQSACGIPSAAVAYSLNVTVVPDKILQYLTLWPSGTPQPFVSTLNSYDGRVKANAAILAAGSNGGVSVFVSDSSNVILDIDGYFVPAATDSALAFYPLAPCRAADTRASTGSLGGPFLAGQTSRSFPIQSSSCGIPANAQAYSMNVTTVPHKTLNYLTTWPTGQPQPYVSTLNAPTGAVTANAAIVPAGASGAVSFFVSDDADVILDVNGYFAPPSTGGLSLYTAQPCRVLDTRSLVGAFNGILPNGVPVQSSSCALPAAAQAYVLNATAVPPGPLVYLTLWPDGESQPYVSTLNADDGAITSNMAIVPTIDGTIDVFSSNATQLILDSAGYFAP